MGRIARNRDWEVRVKQTLAQNGFLPIRHQTMSRALVLFTRGVGSSFLFGTLQRKGLRRIDATPYFLVENGFFEYCFASGREFPTSSDSPRRSVGLWHHCRQKLLNLQEINRFRQVRVEARVSGQLPVRLLTISGHGD